VTTIARIPWRLRLLVATAFGLSSTYQAHWLVILHHETPAPPLLHLLAINLVYWYIPALLAPAIVGNALRYQWGRVPWSTQIGVHVAGALAYSAVHTAVMVVFRTLLVWLEGWPAGALTWYDYAPMYYFRQLDWLFMTYLFIVGLAHALAYRRESEQRALDTAHLETRLMEAQLQALQRQLHPHFLFNTLNTIAGLIRIDVDAADRMIDRLGDLLRMTVHTSGMQEVALKQELEMLQKYIEIEQTRFGDRLRISMNIQPETLDARVPNLLLQPLVENAIRHGIAPNGRPGWIALDCSRDGEQLTIQIRDSGNGLPPERLMALNRGVGLANTRARLEHLYRSSHRFAFANVPGGFCVTVSIPFQVIAPAPEPLMHAGVA
jgi:signal transduction histidine kinase